MMVSVKDYYPLMPALQREYYVHHRQHIYISIFHSTARTMMSYAKTRALNCFMF